jgi:site-specific DNA recombinase
MACILLSFAQFEREVTGERIRDKIAASKRRGMWMGGRVPLGYDVRERKLLVNQEEAKLVNNLYHRYLELGSVSKLKAYLDHHGIKSKERISPAGIRSGGVSFFPGALYLILQNPIYRGEVRHRNQSYPGQHEAIISLDLWDKVQNQLRSDNRGRRTGAKANCSSMLVGVLQDAEGNRFRPSHTVKNGKRYRYYFCHASGRQAKAIRLPAHDVEKQVSLRLQSFLRSPNEVMKSLTLSEDDPETTQTLIAAALTQAEDWSTASPATLRDFDKKVVRRVIIQTEKMDVETSRSEVRAILTNNQLRASGRESQEATPDDLVRLTVARRGASR